MHFKADKVDGGVDLLEIFLIHKSCYIVPPHNLHSDQEISSAIFWVMTWGKIILQAN